MQRICFTGLLKVLPSPYSPSGCKHRQVFSSMVKKRDENKMKVEGKVACVMGGAEGTGKACVKALISAGAKVCFGDILEKEGTELWEQMKKQRGDDCVTFKKADVRSQQEIHDLFCHTADTFGVPDIFLNIAGTIDEFDWQFCVDTNFNGTIRSTNAVLQHMGKDKGGKGGVAIYMSSMSALRPSDWFPVYVGTKHAILGYIRSWAEPKNYEGHGIRFNVMCPSAIDTNLAQITARSDKVYYCEERKEMRKDLDLLSPERVAEAFMLLVEDDSRNGEALTITSAGGFIPATFPTYPSQ